MSLKLYSTEFMTRRECKVDAAVDAIEGQFVANKGDNVFGLASATYNVYQVWTGRKTDGAGIRTDIQAILTDENPTVDAIGQVTGLFGQYIAEVNDDCFTEPVGGWTINMPLTVTAGLLVEATGDAPIVAYVDELPVNNDSLLRFRRV